MTRIVLLSVLALFVASCSPLQAAPAHAGPPASNYIGSFHARVTIDGIKKPLNLYIKQLRLTDGTKVTIEEFESRSPKPSSKSTTVTMTRDHVPNDPLADWNKTRDKRNVKVDKLDAQKRVVAKYLMANASPSSWKLPSLELDNPGQEEISLAVEQVLQLE
jgi:hypothetical protein